MKLTRANIGELSLDEFVGKVTGIYNKQDEKRSIWDIWLHANHHASSIGEEARKYEPGKKLLEEIADFTMWLFTLVGRIRGPIGSVLNSKGIEECTIRTEKVFSDLIWNKYPGICPVCFFRRTENGVETSHDDFGKPCDCLLYPVETRDQADKKHHIRELRKYAKRHEDDKRQSVDDWQQMFRDIFKANLRHLCLEDIAFHLLEEVGEVSDAMSRMYTYLENEFELGEPSWRQIWLENEIADVASWTFTLVNSLELMPKIAREFQQHVFGTTVTQDKEITLSGIIWSRYGSKERECLYCPHDWKQPVCKCPIQLVSNEGDLEKLQSFTTDVLAEN